MSENQSDILGEDTHGNNLLAAEAAVELDDSRWPKTMAELVDVYTSAAVREGIAPDTDRANHIARWVVLTLGQHFGGRMTYLPRGDQLKTALRHNQIWAEFTGNNVEALASKYKLSSVRVYKIIQEQRALHRAKVQPQLPFNNPAEHPAKGA